MLLMFPQFRNTVALMQCGFMVVVARQYYSGPMDGTHRYTHFEGAKR